MNPLTSVNIKCYRGLLAIRFVQFSIVILEMIVTLEILRSILLSRVQLSHELFIYDIIFKRVNCNCGNLLDQTLFEN